MPPTQRGNWGCATPADRAIWFYFIIALAAGITMAVVGGIKRTNCANQYNDCIDHTPPGPAFSNNPDGFDSFDAVVQAQNHYDFCWQKYHDDCNYTTYNILLWVGVVLCIKAPILMVYYFCRSRRPAAQDGSATVTVTAVNPTKAQGHPVANPAYGVQPVKV